MMKMPAKYNEKNVLYLRKEVFKIRNSKNRYIEIPEEFLELTHGDITDRIERQETQEELSVVFVFKKENLKKSDN